MSLMITKKTVLLTFEGVKTKRMCRDEFNELMERKDNQGDQDRGI